MPDKRFFPGMGNHLTLADLLVLIGIERTSYLSSWLRIGVES
jgi:hypothetical protein